MTKYVVGPKILKKEQVLISIFLIAILVLSSGSMVAFASGGSSSTHVVLPNGHDDTKDIQRALNTCTDAGPQCTVQLVKGTYTISSQITVYGFQGSFVGAGQGQTNIVALGNMSSPNPKYNIPCKGFPDCTSTTGRAGGVPYWVGLPGPKNPWPAIFTFEGGSIMISGMTITDTSPTPISPGWYLPAEEGNGLFYTALQAAIFITGLRASATIDHVSIVGAAGSSIGNTGGYNIGNGILIDSTRLPSTWTYPDADLIQLQGTFSITNSVFDNVQSGAFVAYLLNSNVAICDNTVSSAGIPTGSFYPLGALDISNTNVLICRNQGTVPNAAAIEVLQSIRIPGLLPSTVTITNNNFQDIQGANAVVVEDAGEAFFGTPVTLNAVVSGNTFQNSYPGGSGWYYSAIVSITLKSTLISSNNIAGGGSDGIYLNGGPGAIVGNTITGAYDAVSLDVASGVHVAGNVIRNSVNNGINVTSINYAGSSSTSPSSHDFIVGNFVHNSGSYDLYWDGSGTNNHWCGNVYKTSSPSVLPSC